MSLFLWSLIALWYLQKMSDEVEEFINRWKEGMKMFDKLNCWWNGHDVQYGKTEYAPGGHSLKITPDYCQRCGVLEDDDPMLDEWLGFLEDLAARIEAWYWKVKTGEVLCISFGHQWEYDYTHDSGEFYSCSRCMKRRITVSGSQQATE